MEPCESCGETPNSTVAKICGVEVAAVQIGQRIVVDYASLPAQCKDCIQRNLPCRGAEKFEKILED